MCVLIAILNLMGFKVNINTVLRYDITEPLEVGKEYAFKKPELCLLADSIQIWLTSKDWTALADIQITSQLRKDNETTGTFVVKHVYSGDEQRILTDVFRRMYGWE